MQKRVSATEARVHFGEVLRSVESNSGPVIVERDGRAVAAVISMTDFDDWRKSKADDWWEAARQSREIVARAYAGEPIPDANELIDGGRDDID